MPRCSCGAGTCSCNVDVDNSVGVNIAGDGSSTDPWTFTVDGSAIDVAGILSFQPSTTVEFTQQGEGSTVSPLTVFADAKVAVEELTNVTPADVPVNGDSLVFAAATGTWDFKKPSIPLTSLSDVNDPEGAPTNGQVPTWVTDHWEFKTPAAVPPGTVSASNGIGGDGSSGNPLKALTSGTFGTAPLSTPPFPAVVQDFGNEIYLDTTGKLRARPQVLWRSLDANAAPSAYPMGASIMSVGAENVTGWPGGNFGTVHTIKRMEASGSGSTNGQTQQWWYRNAAADVMYRYAASDAGGWSGWLTVYVAMSEIPNAANLNTYTRPGQYAQQQNAEAAAGTNYPVPYAGMLEVGSTDIGNMVWQRYTTYAEAGASVQGNATYQRAYYGSPGAGWGPWRGVADPALPDIVDAYVSADQTIVGTSRPTETPTAVRATIVNPHQTRRMLVDVFCQGWVQGTGLSANTAVYYEYLTVSGSPAVGIPTFAAREDTQVGSVAGATFYKGMMGMGKAWIPAGGTVVFGIAITRGASGGGTILARYNHMGIAPIRYE